MLRFIPLKVLQNLQEGMGLEKAKSLLTVTEGNTFLDLLLVFLKLRGKSVHAQIDLN